MKIICAIDKINTKILEDDLRRTALTDLPANEYILFSYLSLKSKHNLL